jgi:hypothetical protein
MITNKGKNIVAKYLIGDAPAYASYIALGCGSKPRPNINEKTGVSIAAITGTVAATSLTTQVVGLTSTTGLVVGMTLTKTAGVGVFGGVTTITSIDSPTRITITSTTANTTGSITFNTGGIASVLSVSNVSGLWVGAKVSIKSGTGQFAVEDTIITTIDSSVSNFTITPAAVVNPASATISLEVDPKKESLDFEMFRVPISSRGYVNDQGVNKIVLTAQLPTEERYEFSEVGVYSAGSNSSAGQYDSKTITGFSADENWQLSVDGFLFGPSLVVPNETLPVFPDVQSSLIDGANVMNVDRLAIKTGSTNGIFTNSTRSSRYERPRFLNNVFMLKTESSQIFTTLQSESSILQIQPGAKFLQLSGASIDLSRNSASDLIKLAFSLVSYSGNSNVPDYSRIIIEFANSSNSQVAQLQINASNARLDFSSNRYIVGEKRLDELFYNVGNQFSWRDVSVIRVYASATNRLATTFVSTAAGVGTITTGSNHNLAVNDYVAIFDVDSKVNGVRQVTAKTDNTFEFQIESLDTMTSTSVPLGLLEITDKNYYVALDALRLDNISTANPLYGLTGYSIIQNIDELTILKSPNTNNYIEYRFILDVT